MSPSPDIRMGIRAVLQAAEGFRELSAHARRTIAQALVKIGATASDLARIYGSPVPDATPRPVPFARAMVANAKVSGAAVDRVAPTTERILNAVSFPRFVGELITGVFKAMNESNQEQLTAYVELIKNVAATTDGFADANISLTAARNWLAERFAGQLEVRGDEETSFDDPAKMSDEERREWQTERDESTRLALVPGAQLPTEAAVRTALGIDESDNVPTGNPELLVPLARSAMARSRQETLSTMVMMGLQQIVVDGGRLNASMRFHIDATSAAEAEQGSRTEIGHDSTVGARAQFGPWGAAAKMRNTFSYVSTERSSSEEVVNAEVDLNSSVELVFRTDYVPLERLAGADDVKRIQLNSLNPTAEQATASRPGVVRATARENRSAAARQDLLPRSGIGATEPAMEVPGPESAPFVEGISADVSTPSPAEQTQPSATESSTTGVAPTTENAG